jgi:TRAP-type C4-dicarboxylate transport system permease small subunit
MPHTISPHPEEVVQRPSRKVPDRHADSRFRKAMDALHWGCAIIAGTALVVISLIVPWGVYTRYVLESAASWPEPAAVLLSIVLTFFGAAACYRTGVHMRVTALRDIMPGWARQIFDLVAEGLLALVALFMVIWGARLCAATWQQAIAEFPFLRTGITYLPIPIGGVVTLLFVAERLLIGPPPQEEDWRNSAPD